MPLLVVDITLMGKKHQDTKISLHPLSFEKAMATVKDPVCGMEIDPNNAAATEEYQEKMYHFCPAACHDKFKAEPQKYTS